MCASERHVYDPDPQRHLSAVSTRHLHHRDARIPVLQFQLQFIKSHWVRRRVASFVRSVSLSFRLRLSVNGRMAIRRPHAPPNYHSAIHTQSCFSDFVFKIRLIMLGFSFQKNKSCCIWIITYWLPVRILNHYTTEPTVSGRHRKTFSSLQSCLTESSWIHLILLIQLI